MPTIIYVHEIGEGGEVTPTYVNADQIRRVYTSSRLHLTLFADGSAMLTQESPDEIAALIHDAMNPAAAQGYPTGIQQATPVPYPECPAESTSDGRQ